MAISPIFPGGRPMHPNDLNTLLNRQPFQPFRIVTTDGTTYLVRHPRLVMVGTRSVIIGYPDETVPDAYARYDIVSLLHIIRLEEGSPPVATA
jgi:hypothetical protein